MFVVSNRNIVLPSPNGEKFRMVKGYMGPVPAWAEDSAYLNALVADGKVIVSESGADKDFAKKERKSKKVKSPEKEPDNEPTEEDPEPEGQEMSADVAE